MAGLEKGSTVGHFCVFYGGPKITAMGGSFIPISVKETDKNILKHLQSGSYKKWEF